MLTTSRTPKDASWLNVIKQRFSTLTRSMLRYGDCAPLDDLEARTSASTVRYNRTARPYLWRYDIDAEHVRYLERHTRYHAIPTPSTRPHAFTHRHPLTAKHPGTRCVGPCDSGGP